MTKRDIITQIRKARASHVHWKSYVFLGLRGIVTDHDKTNFPIVQTECDFGKWFYANTAVLSKYLSFPDLEKPHEMVHDLYIQIYAMQNARLKGGLFTNKNKLLQSRQHDISDLVSKLNNYSGILLDTLKRLEEEVSEEKDDFFIPDSEVNIENSEELPTDSA